VRRSIHIHFHHQHISILIFCCLSLPGVVGQQFGIISL
jgi:hypothetical protein